MPPYRRERIATPDDDFLDLDWVTSEKNRVAILSHGLEGDTGRVYVKGMCRALHINGWDVLAWNYRSCSGEPNRKLRFYHSGATEDLDVVIQYALQKGYESVALVGFSLGGNLSLKYLGERKDRVDPRIKKAVAWSPPCDLGASARKMTILSNRLYMMRFTRSLHQKIVEKSRLFPDAINDEGFDKIKTFQDFDDRYTAPLHGFVDAEDYWRQCSSKRFVPGIKIPSLIVIAKDDPFMTEEVWPVEEAKANPIVQLELPKWGGHVGFMALNSNGIYWSEQRTIEFLKDV